MRAGASSPWPTSRKASRPQALHLPHERPRHMSHVDKIGSTWSHLCAPCYMAGVSISLTQTHHWSFSVSHRKHIVFSCLSQFRAPY